MTAAPRVDSPQAHLRREGLGPRKRLGQHFLRDRSVLPRILDAAALDAGDAVLEIGAGTGVLTEALAAVAQRVVAVELDDALYHLLSDTFQVRPHVEIRHGNALDVVPSDLFDGPYKLVANIPYYITGPIVRHFLEASVQPELLVLMVQREVAERMVAAPGRLSLLGVSVQYYAEARIISRVPAGAFYPRPKVESAIIRLRPRRGVERLSTDAFFTVARAGFSQRRKQLVNSLAAGLDLPREAVQTLLESAGLEPTDRAEVIPVDGWERLAAAWLAGAGAERTPSDVVAASVQRSPSQEHGRRCTEAATTLVDCTDSASILHQGEAVDALV